MSEALLNYLSYVFYCSSRILLIGNMKSFYFLCAFCVSLLAVIYAAEPAKSGCLEKEKALAILETVEDLLSKAGDSFPSCKKDLNSTDESECANEKPLAYIEISKKLISDVRENFPACYKSIEKDDKIAEEEKDDIIVQEEKLRHCSQILARGHRESGVYTIWPEEPSISGKSLQVYCDMKTDDGGWTVIQRRGKFPVQQDFYLGWESYKNGFGNITQEFWLGNENIRVLCHEGCKIRFDLQDENGEKSYAIYQSFSLSGSNYRLSISGYNGNAGDDMKDLNNYDFSTKDKGNTNKAVELKGAWWYRGSHNRCNLNGIYRPGKSEYESVYWLTWRNTKNLASVEIKVIPK